MESEAVLSRCRQYRYLLRRAWDDDLPRSLFVMLNPSTADETKDDPTIRRCINFAKAWGHGSIEVVNLFALRATNPSELASAPDPIGSDNNDIIEAARRRCDLVVCAWGAHPAAADRAMEVTNIVRVGKPAIYCLGTTKSGEPRHPLYLRADAVPRAYR